MTHNDNYGEFKGTTKQALKDMGKEIGSLKEDNKSEFAELRQEISGLRRWLIVLSIVVTIAVIERAPDLFKVLTAVAAGN